LHHVVRHNLAVLIWAHRFYKLSRPARHPPGAPRRAGGQALPGPIKISSAAIVRSFIPRTAADCRRSVSYATPRDMPS
jgi:hypothetical protein